MFALRRNRKLKIGLFITLVILTAWFLFDFSPRYQWKHERDHLLKKFSNHKSNSVVNSQATCSVPNLNPFSDEVLHLMRKQDYKCQVVRYGKIVDKTYVLEDGNFREVTIEYIRRAPKEGEISNDFAVTYSKKIPVPKINGE